MKLSTCKITLYVGQRPQATPWLLIQSVNEGRAIKPSRRMIPSDFVDLPRIERVLTAVVFSQVNWVATITLVSTGPMCSLSTCFLSEAAKSEPTASVSQSIRFASQPTVRMVPKLSEMPKIRGWVHCSQDPSSSLNMVWYKW